MAPPDNLITLRNAAREQPDSIALSMQMGGLSQHQARWHSEKAHELIDLPSLDVWIPYASAEQRDAVERLKAQVEAREYAYKVAINVVLFQLYDALWPSGPGGGSRKAA